MPELPEVETVMLGLAPVMTGKTIANVDVRRPDLRWPFPEQMAARLNGKTVLQLRRRSKYILVDLSSGESLIIHLGMSGRMLIQHGTEIESPAKHDHVIFDMECGTRIVFNDARRFGAMDLCVTEQEGKHRFLAALGPEPLGNSFNENYLAQALKSRNTPIKTALLDQKLVAGLGNIYVCEVLWHAHVSPVLKACDLSKKRVQSLVPLIRSVLTDAIASGGSSLKDYRQADGELGYFQHSFTAYGREGKTCRTPECGGIISRISQSGRSTFYCPNCQR